MEIYYWFAVSRRLSLIECQTLLTNFKTIFQFYAPENERKHLVFMGSRNETLTRNGLNPQTFSWCDTMQSYNKIAVMQLPEIFLPCSAQSRCLIKVLYLLIFVIFLSSWYNSDKLLITTSHQIQLVFMLLYIHKSNAEGCKIKSETK